MFIDVTQPGDKEPRYIEGPTSIIDGPINVEIIKKKGGGERILLNNFDISMITSKYEIHSRPASLKELVVTIPIGHITTRDE